jgi:Protein of unknown function (DUF2934)
MKTNANANTNDRDIPNAALRLKIEERAYHFWLESGCVHGDHEHHWFQAEREVVEAAKQEQRPSGREKKRIGKSH